MDGLFLNQKTNKNIRISYSLKYKHSKRKSFTKKLKIVYYEINIPGGSVNEKTNSTMSVMLCKEATFVKKNFCLVARIVSFDTAKSGNSMFLNSEFFLLTRMFTI